MKNKPKISIITVCYNAEAHIEEAILSVINQNYLNKEYIVVDGGSKDSTMSIVNKYKDNIATIISEPDKGISDAFNKGILASTGDLIGICNADDVLLDGALEIIASKYRAGIDVFRFGETIWNGETGLTIKVTPSPIRRIPLKANLLHMGCWITKEAFQKYGLYDLNFKYCMDYELIRRMTYRGAKLSYHDEQIGKFRVGGISSNNSTKMSEEKIEICKRYGAGVIGGYIWIAFDYLLIAYRTFVTSYHERTYRKQKK